MRLLLLTCLVLAWTLLVSLFWPDSANAVATRFENAPLTPASGLLTEKPDLQNFAPTSCTPIDLRAGIARNRFQGETSFCYAYATATIVNQRTGIDVSALDLASTFYFTQMDHLARHPNPSVAEFLRQNPDWRNEITEVRDDAEIDESTAANGSKIKRPYFPYLAGGTEEVAILLSNVSELCRDQDLPSDQGFQSHRKQIQDFIRIAEASTGPTPQELEHVYPKFRDPVADFFNAEWLRYQNRRCQRVTSPVPLLPVRYYAADSYEDYLNRIRRGTIDPKKEARELFQALNFALDHQRAPAVGYSLFKFSPREPDDPDEFADHSSAILARKLIGNKCHYLVRDNSGLECSDFFPQYRKRCQDAEVWVTEEELGASMYSVVYLR